jgi:uncharacterized protein YndB with AHSA1/START domain
MLTNEVNTIRLHRVLRATPERIYRAFLDADALAKWLPPNGFTGKVHHLEAKAIPAEACYLGWQESLTLLAKLVEAEIPDQP